MLDFQSDALQDWLSHDSLLVLGKGLGVHSLLLQFFHSIQQTPGPADSSKDGRSCHAAPFGGSAEALKDIADDIAPCRAKLKTKLVFLVNTSQEEAEILVHRLQLRQAAAAREVEDDVDRSTAHPTVVHDGEWAERQDELADAAEEEMASRSDGQKHRQQRGQSVSATDRSSTQNTIGKNRRHCFSATEGWARLRLQYVNAEYQQEQRASLFARGGCFVVSSRILITELLTGKLPAEMVDGIIVNHAHKICSNWNDAFILRVYRSKNRRGFLKAITDEPEALTRGFCKLDKTLKCLLLQHVFFYPRFNDRVNLSLNGEPQPSTCEVTFNMTRLVAEMQHALVCLLEKGLVELKKTRHADLSDLRLDECMLKAFELQLHERLDPVWHCLHQRTRRLVQDLSIVRRLLPYIAKYDCVHLLSFLESLRGSEGTDSILLRTTEAELVFKRSQERVYNVVRSFSSGKPTAKLQPVLEQNPKWSHIRDLVWQPDISPALLARLTREAGLEQVEAGTPGQTTGAVPVRQGKRRKVLSSTGPATRSSVSDTSHDDDDGSSGIDYDHQDDGNLHCLEIVSEIPEYRIMIVVDDEMEERQICTMLLQTPQQMLSNYFRSYVFSHRSRAMKPSPVVMSTGGPGQAARGDAKAKGAGTAAWQRPWSGSSVSSEVLKLFGDYLDRNVPTLAETAVADAATVELMDIASRSDDTGNRETESTRQVLRRPIVVRSGGASGQLELLLRQRQPHCVVLANPDLRRVREVEVYCAEMYQIAAVMKGSHTDQQKGHAAATRRPRQGRPSTPEATKEVLDVEQEGQGNEPGGTNFRSHPVVVGGDVRVVLLVYNHSLEQHKFLNSSKAEKSAWESLAQQRRHLLVTPDETALEGIEREAVLRQAALSGCRAGDYEGSGSALSSRQAGGGRAYMLSVLREIQPTVIVDMREFRSALPFQLYQKRLLVVPLTITVGDYVLSRDICVERKSLPDLVSSLNSGRLYHQVREMCRCYRDATLLIEFERGKPFSLQCRQALGPDIGSTNILSKLVLLLLHFPSLKLIWSPHAVFTADAFTVLKAGREQPNPEKAIAAGTEERQLAESIEAVCSAPENKNGSTTAPALPDVVGPGSESEEANEAQQKKPEEMRRELVTRCLTQSTHEPLRYRQAEASTNPVAVDVLRRLPGVQDKLVNKIVTKVKSLAELVRMSEEELAALVGRESARKLEAFFSAPIVVSEDGSSQKPGDDATTVARS